jgi:hypothetical protein
MIAAKKIKIVRDDLETRRPDKLAGDEFDFSRSSSTTVKLCEGCSLADHLGIKVSEGNFDHPRIRRG